MSDPLGIGQINREIVRSAMMANKDYKAADTFYENLSKQFRAVWESLEVGQVYSSLYYLPGGEKVTIHDIGYQNPNLLIFIGVDQDGNPCRIVAHMDTVQIVIRTVNAEDKKAKRKIGFIGEQPSETGVE